MCTAGSELRPQAYTWIVTVHVRTEFCSYGAACACCCRRLGSRCSQHVNVHSTSDLCWVCNGAAQGARRIGPRRIPGRPECIHCNSVEGTRLSCCLHFRVPVTCFFMFRWQHRPCCCRTWSCSPWLHQSLQYLVTAYCGRCMGLLPARLWPCVSCFPQAHSYMQHVSTCSRT